MLNNVDGCGATCRTCCTMTAPYHALAPPIGWHIQHGSLYIHIIAWHRLAGNCGDVANGISGCGVTCRTRCTMTAPYHALAPPIGGIYSLVRYIFMF